MKRACLCVLLGVVTVATGVQTQAPERLPSFDVASVKKNTSGDTRMRMVTQPGGRLVVTNAPLRDLIATAYSDVPQQLPRFRMFGGPEWIDAERYDINAKSATEFRPAPGPSRELLLMMRSLLEE